MLSYNCVATIGVCVFRVQPSVAHFFNLEVGILSNEINQRIKSVRKELGIKQKDMAGALGIKESTYSQMERTGNITCETAIKIARIFDTDLNHLILGLEQTAVIPPEEKKKESHTTVEETLILTPNEESIIKILRHFGKLDREECIAFIEKKYHNTL